MIYLFGYTGHPLDELKERAEALNAVVVDIRYAARSRNPEWNKSAMMSSLGPGNYLHLKD